VLFRVTGLPDEPLAAAAHFHSRILPDVLARFGPPHPEHGIVLAFPQADHTHRAWRLAVIQGLAREHAPSRVNAVAGGTEAAIAATLEWLARAPGVTGQYWSLDAGRAGRVW